MLSTKLSRQNVAIASLLTTACPSRSTSSPAARGRSIDPRMSTPRSLNLIGLTALETILTVEKPDLDRKHHWWSHWIIVGPHLLSKQSSHGYCKLGYSASDWPGNLGNERPQSYRMPEVSHLGNKIGDYQCCILSMCLYVNMSKTRTILQADVKP